MLKGMEENNEHTIRLVGLSFHREELTSWERRDTVDESIMHRVEGGSGNDDVLHKIKSTIYSPCVFLSLSLRNYIINISWFDLLRG